MDYELCKKLKDAGFPLPRTGGWFRKDGEKSVAAPNLSELINECGDRFKTLTYFPANKSWLANGWNLLAGQNGFTPEEAVANLWLSLKK